MIALKHTLQYPQYISWFQLFSLKRETERFGLVCYPSIWQCGCQTWKPAPLKSWSVEGSMKNSNLLLDVALPFDLTKQHQHQQKTWLLKPSPTVETVKNVPLDSEHLHYSSWSPRPSFPNERQHLKRRTLDDSTAAQPCLFSDQVKHLWRWHQDCNSCRPGPGSWISFTVPWCLAILFICDFL